MTEEEWLNATEPHAMLGFLQTAGGGSARKLRLCAVACCRRIWHFLPCHRCREAVRCAELLADGLLGEREREESLRQALDAFIVLGAVADALSCGTWTALDILTTEDERDRYDEVYQQAYQEARHSVGDANEAWEASSAALAAYRVLIDDESGCLALFHAAKTVALGCRHAHPEASDPPDTLHARQNPCAYAEPEAAYRPADPTESARQCDVIAEIFGNPFRPVELNPIWVSSMVVALAQAAYDEPILPAGTLDPDRLAVLADALEDSGCTDPAILHHLRGPGPHVRGCFVIDALLGNK
jgi:hypothetical protein